jgi:dynein assembly factor with WDR repeat domains 1
VSLHFNTDGDKLLTSSFDNTAKIWDVCTGQCLFTLEGHSGELSCGQFDFTGDYCLTGSIDRTCKLWDVGTG